MDKRHLQIRMSSETQKELREVSKRLGLPASDIVRGALFFGLPTVIAMSELQDEIINRLIRKLKGEARLRRSC
jgi:predicted DNA-binding protein